MEAYWWVWPFGGFIAAMVLIATLTSWAQAIVEVRREHPDRGWVLVTATSLFNAGPWALLAFGIFVYFEYSEPWAPWFFAGFVAWTLYFVSIVTFVRWKQKRKREKVNAA